MNKNKLTLNMNKIPRRQALLLMGSTAASAALVACGSGSSNSSSNSSSSDSSGSSDNSALDCVLIPEETRGPYPLDLSGDNSYFRQDITEDRTGVPLTITLTLLNINDDCSPVTSARVDVWHCDKDGLYSGYDNTTNRGQAGETYLRGIQLSGSDGSVTFDTIYPGWYAGRITHVHFEVYLNDSRKAVSQLAFPQDTTKEVYNSSLYASHGQNTSVTSFNQDNVFSDGTSRQMLSMSGNLDNGYVGTLTVGLDI